MGAFPPLTNRIAPPNPLLASCADLVAMCKNLTRSLLILANLLFLVRPLAAGSLNLFCVPPAGAWALLVPSRVVFSMLLGILGSVLALHALLCLRSGYSVTRAFARCRGFKTSPFLPAPFLTPIIMYTS